MRILSYVLFGALGLASLSGCAPREDLRPNKVLLSKSQTKLVHEYLDLNENGAYETHRVVFEGDKGRRIYSVDSRPFEMTRKQIEDLPLVGDERRFLK